MRLHLCPLFLLIHFALNPSMPQINFSFVSKRSLPYQGFFVSSFKESPDFGTSIETIHKVDFAAFSGAIRN